MTLFPPRKKTKPPPPPPTKPSGEHEAVRTFRNKLQSITEGALEDAKSLDEQLAEYIASESVPPPDSK